MFDRFGEFDSAAEINETAVNLRREGDIESLKVLAAENGIDPEILEEFAKGKQIYLCDDMVAALGKLDVEVILNRGKRCRWISTSMTVSVARTSGMIAICPDCRIT